MAVRPRVVALPPREIHMPFDAEQFGSGAHDQWYRDVISWGELDRHSIDSADDWWRYNVRVGDGYYTYGMPHPSTEGEVRLAYDYFIVMAMDLLRERLMEQLA